MKRHLGFLLFVLSILFIGRIDETNGLEKNLIKFNNLSSNNFVTFVKGQNIYNRISKICSNDFCDYLRGSNIEDSFEIFKSKYQDYLMEKENEEVAHSTVLKGFPITSINVLD